MEKKCWGQFMENFAQYGIWADFTSNGEPLRLYQQERVVMKTMLKGWYCNKLPLIEETDEQRLLEPSRPLYMSGEP